MSWPRYRFAQNGLGPLLLSPRLSFARQEILRLGPVAWFRYNTGITVATGVSQWDDQSGNGNHLKQSTGANQPAKQSDGSILFDGASDYLKCSAFTLNQPETVYLLYKPVSWTRGDVLFDGNALNGGLVIEDIPPGGGGVSPNLYQYAGTAGGQDASDAVVGSYCALASVFNGASSRLQINNNAAGTGDAGTNDMGGFTLGASGTPASYSNIQVKEAIIFPVAHDANQRATVIAYLLAL